MLGRIAPCVILIVGLAFEHAGAANGARPGDSVDSIPRKLFQQFNSKHDNRWKVEWNRATGAPRRISGSYIDIKKAPTAKNVEPVTRSVLSTHRNLLQLDTKDLELAAADFDPAPDSKAAGTWHVRYRQTYKGLPVHGGGARLVIHGNRLTMLGSDFYPSIAVRVKPRISADKAVAAAHDHMRAKDSDGSVSRELVIYPKVHDSQVDYHLSWKITLPVLYNPAPGLKPESSNLPPRRRTDPVQWLYFVDAHSGAILDRFNVIRSQLGGTVTGMVHNSATSAPVSVPISDLSIGVVNIVTRTKPRPGGRPIEPVQPNTRVVTPPCPESLATTTGSTGQYQFPSLTGCNRTFLLSHLEGPFTRIVNLATSDPASFHVAAVSGGTHNWNWANYDRSPDDVETSVFFHVNRVRNWFNRGGPFNVEPALKPMLAHVRDPGMWCNAQMRPDGLFFAAATPSDCPDMGLCGDIVYHEYTHSVVEEVYRPVDGLPLFGETLAMHEAFADYFAQSIVDNPRTAPTCTGAYSRNLQTDKRYPEHIDSDPHVYGLILSGALWDVRTALGRDFVDGLALRAMKQWPMSFSEFLDAAVAEDDLLGYQLGADSNVSNGSPNIQAICTAFVENHGIYHPVCAGFTTAPTAIIRSPAKQSSPFLVRSGTSTVEIRGAAAGSRNAALASFTIEYANEPAPYTWQTTGVALSGGGATAVADGVLANWNLSAVADGSYVVRLSVTDSAGGVSRYEVKVMIDRLLRAGWPAQILGGSATSYGNLVSAGVGNIVSASGGQEIFLLSCNGYILRPDGSLYTAFNIPGNSCEMAAPAIGDIDGDGDPDIVVASSEYLAAFRNDGNQLFDTVFSVAFGPGLPVGAPASPVLRDLDGDGRMEIIMAGLDGKLYIYRHDGTPFSHGGFTWPKSAAGPLRGTPAVADLDGDGRPEILVGSEDGNFYAWKLDGTNAAGWPKPVGRPIRSSAAVGNLDGDAANSLEVVVGAADGRVYAWSSDGSPVPGWPVSVVAMRPVSSAPALADLDNDGKLEVLAHGDAATLQIFKHDGTAFPGWTFPITGLTGHAPVVADLDGDQFPEIIVGPLQGKVFAFHRDGSSVSGFPRVPAQNVPGMDARRTPVLADLDGDGRLELIVGAYVWNLPGSFNPLKQEWPTFHHDMTRSGKH